MGDIATPPPSNNSGGGTAGTGGRGELASRRSGIGEGEPTFVASVIF